MAGLAKAGTLSIVGTYPQAERHFPIGQALHQNLTIKLGSCRHRKHIPRLIALTQSRRIEPAMILTQREPIGAAMEDSLPPPSDPESDRRSAL